MDGPSHLRFQDDAALLRVDPDDIEQRVSNIEGDAQVRVVPTAVDDGVPAAQLQQAVIAVDVESLASLGRGEPP